MAKKVVVESVDERKNRIKAYLQGEDPAVRFVADSGMGLKRLFSEEVLLPPEFNYIEEPTRTVLKVRKDSKYGFVKVSGKVVTPCIYDFAESFSEGRACVKEEGRFRGFIDEDGQEVIDLGVEDNNDLPRFENGLTIIKKNGLEGVIDLDGKEILPCKFSSIRMELYNGDLLGLIIENGGRGFADRNGKVIVPPEFDYVYPYPERVYRVSKDDKYGLLDSEGKEVIPISYNDITPFDLYYYEYAILRFHKDATLRFRECHQDIGGLFITKKDGKVGVVSGDGSIQLDPQYDELDVLFDCEKDDSPGFCRMQVFTTLLKAKQGNRYSIIDLSGKEIVPPGEEFKSPGIELISDYPHASFIQEDNSYRPYCYYDKTIGKYGIRDWFGKRLTAPKYKEQPYNGWSSNGRFFIQVEERPDYGTKLFGLVDDKGVEVMPCIYDDYGLNVNDGLIFATKKKKEGVFSLDGDPIIKCAWRECRRAEAGTIWAEKKNTCALFTRSGAIVVEEGPYDKCSPSIDGLLELRSAEYNRDYYYMDLWGNVMKRGKR